MDESWPAAPMLARLTRQLPEGEFMYEPKWDGFRCLVKWNGDEVDMRSRSGRPLARYFPELVDALRRVDARGFVVDGEILAMRDGAPDFASLMARLHPAASRVHRLSTETPASMILFDVLEIDGRNVTAEPFHRRRSMLETLMDGIGSPLFLSELTRDVDTAREWLDRAAGPGIDGVMAKLADRPYLPGKREMLKVKTEHTADCVVAGLRCVAGAREVGSLLLGLYDDSVLRHVGVVTSFPKAMRRELIDELAPAVVPIGRHPWRDGFALEGGPMGRLPGAAGKWTPDMGLDWVPMQPVRVAEVAFDQVDGIRFRHPARFRRWRPDREASSCTVDQLREASWPHA
jgi:ATP-dependent DNA ligase